MLKVAFVFAFISSLVGALSMNAPVQASPGINQQINFQARLLNSLGATAPDGTYNLEFKIYQGGAGCVVSGTSPCGGTLKWTEDWLVSNTQGVVVKNGYFSVYLGSINTALASLVDFNDDTLWVSLNIGNTSSCTITTNFTANCGGDTEMLPFKRFASTPYALNALNANKLGGLISSQYIQLAQGLQADSSTTNASVAINKTGTTADILDLQRNGTSVLKVANNGSAIFKNQTDTASAFTVQNTATGASVFTVDTSANKVLLGKAGPTGLAGALAFSNASNAFTSGFNSGVTTGASYSFTLPTALPGSTQCITSTTGGVMSYSSCGPTTLASSYSGGASQTDSTMTLDSTRLGVVIQDAATPISGNLLTVQKNGGGATFLGVSTSAVTLQDASGNNALVFDSTTSTLKVYENIGSPANFAQIYYSSGEAVFAASTGTTRIGSGSGNITMALTGNSDVLTFSKTSSPAATYSATDYKITRNLTGTSFALGGAVLKVEDLSTFSTGSSAPDVLLINQNNIGATGNLINAQLNGASKFSVNTAGTATIAAGQSYTGAGAVTVSSGAASALTLTGNAASTWSTSSGLLTLQGNGGLTLNSTGANALTIDSTTTGTVSIGSNANAKIISMGNNQAGTSIDLDAGTSATGIEIGNTSSAHGIQIGSNATSANAIVIGGVNAGSTLSLEAGTGATALQIGNGTTAHNILIGAGGAAAGAVQSVTIGSDSTTSASDVTLQAGNITTTNNASGIIISGGFSSSDTNLVGLTLDSFATFAETSTTCSNTVNSGTLYFNSNTNTVRVCVRDPINTAGSWEDIPSTAGLGAIMFGVVPDSGLSANQGNWASLNGANLGPCKVSWASTTSVSVAPCVAYSGGRKVMVNTATTVSVATGISATNNFRHICLVGGVPTDSGATTELGGFTGNLAFSANNPVLCLADVKTSATAITQIYDVRTFTTTQREFITIQATGAGLGQTVSVATSAPVANGVVPVPATLNTPNLRGVVVATTGTTSTTTINAIVAIAGPQWVKMIAAAGALNQLLLPVTTGGVVGYVSSSATASTGVWGNLGLQLKLSDNATCSSAANCQMSVPTEIRIR